MKNKVDRLEKIVDENEKRFVTLEHFKDTVRPMRDQMAEMRSDIKSILMIVSKDRRLRRDSEP